MMEEKRIRAEAPDDSPAAAREYPKTEGDEPNDEAQFPDEPDEQDPNPKDGPDREKRN